MCNSIILQCVIPGAELCHRGKANWICWAECAAEQPLCVCQGSDYTLRWTVACQQQQQEKPRACKYHTADEFVTLALHHQHNLYKLIYFPLSVCSQNHILILSICAIVIIYLSTVLKQARPSTQNGNISYCEPILKVDMREYSLNRCSFWRNWP